MESKSFFFFAAENRYKQGTTDLNFDVHIPSMFRMVSTFLKDSHTVQILLEEINH